MEARLMRAIGHGSAATPTLFSLVDEYEKSEEQQPVVEEVAPRKSGFAEILDAVPDRSRGPGVRLPLPWARLPGT